MTPLPAHRSACLPGHRPTCPLGHLPARPAPALPAWHLPGAPQPAGHSPQLPVLPARSDWVGPGEQGGSGWTRQAPGRAGQTGHALGRAEQTGQVPGGHWACGLVVKNLLDKHQPRHLNQKVISNVMTNVRHLTSNINMVKLCSMNEGPFVQLEIYYFAIFILVFDNFATIFWVFEITERTHIWPRFLSESKGY